MNTFADYGIEFMADTDGINRRAVGIHPQLSGCDFCSTSLLNP